jgi:surfeit locus 1 family protein
MKVGLKTVKKMKIEFRPLPVLTFITLIMMGILLSLGTWQYQRLQWKTKLLADIDTAAHAQPLHSIGDINALVTEGKPVDFRRVSLTGTFTAPRVNHGQAFHVLRPMEAALVWQLYQPFISNEQGVYVATIEFDKDGDIAAPKGLSGMATINGYIRLVQPANRFTPNNNPDANRWFSVNGSPELLDWAEAVAGTDITISYFIDQVLEETDANNLPVKIPDIRNHHLDYMLTWYSFVLILLVIYLILHKKQGRLRFIREA